MQSVTRDESCRTDIALTQPVQRIDTTIRAQKSVEWFPEKQTPAWLVALNSSVSIHAHPMAIFSCKGGSWRPRPKQCNRAA